MASQAPQPPASPIRSASPILLGAACLWVVGFLLYFNSFELPNSRPPIPRGDLWLELPAVYAGLLESSPDSGWRNLPQRFDAIAVAAFLVLSSAALGALLLRSLRVPESLTRVERFVFSAGLGLGALSLFTLGCGLAGLLRRDLFVGLLVLAPIAAAVVWWRDRRQQQTEPWGRHSCLPEAAGWKARPTSAAGWKARPTSWLRPSCLIAVAPFLLAIWLGAMLPSFDFDVKEYHLQGPKEFFLNGRIAFLPHNVYTSFPFLTEMLSLAAMVVRGDWYRGALAGKAVLAVFSLLSALAVFALGKRLFGATAGWLGLLIFLTTPWTYRISIIAYAEGGLTFYLVASLLALTLAVRQPPEQQRSASLFLLAGLLAGCAMSCKYPGVVQVVIPLGVAAVAFPWIAGLEPAVQRRTALRAAGAFALGTVLAVGPWLVKNAAETGNPVYPLLASVFPSRDWDAELNAKWRAAHSPPNHAPADLGEKFVDVTARSDWQSGLMFGFAPLALLLPNRRRAGWMWVYVGFLFFAWWVLTHRIDRFWIPLLPVAAVLAGAGAAWSSSASWRTVAIAAIGLTLAYNLAFITTPLCGYNAYLKDEAAAQKEAEKTSAGIPFLNRELPDDARILCVGDAQVFDLRRAAVYNTVFDRSIIEAWCAQPTPGRPAGEWPLKPAAEIRAKLKAEGITHVYVNWQEIQRYRDTYGYTEFVTRRRFRQLVQAGVLGESLVADHSFEVFPVR